MNIKVNDMLVFEDNKGNTYIDFIRKVNVLGNEKFYIRDNLEVYTNSVFMRTLNRGMNSDNYKVKEIWHKIDEDTYKKAYMWSEEFNQMILCRGQCSRTCKIREK